jgi:cell division protein FtsZ
VAAAEMAISSPLLEASIDGAHGVLLSIQGGSDLGLFEINEAAQLVANSAAVDANIIFGAVIDDALGDEVRVTVIAAGFDEQRQSRPASAARVVRPSGAAATGSDGAGGTSGTSSAPPASPAPGVGAAAASAPSFTASAGEAGYSSYSPPAAGTSATANGAARASEPAQPALPAQRAAQAPKAPETPEEPAAARPEPSADEALSDYVPAPVSFVSAEEDGGTSYSDSLADSGLSGSSSWADSGRTSARDKIFDSGAGRRRPVVFEEDDDLDVPDFLK